MSLKLIQLTTVPLDLSEFLNSDLKRDLRFIPVAVQLKIRAPAPVVSAIRRMIISEMPRVQAHVSKKNIETTDEAIIPEMVAKRIGMIAIDQNTKATKLRIDVQNNTDGLLKVFSRQLKSDAGEMPCNGTYELFHLKPGKMLKLEANLRTTYGYAKGGGSAVVAAGVAAVVEDEDTLYDEFSGKGIRAGESDHRDWILKFDTVGTMEPKEIIRAALKGLDSMIADIQHASQNAEKNGNEFIFSIDGHTYSASSLVQYEIANNSTNTIVCSVDEHLRQCKCRMVGGDPADFLGFDSLQSAIAEALRELAGL